MKAEHAGAALDAHLLRCRAVLEEGDAGEAAAEMRTYLDRQDIKRFPVPVRALYSEIQSRLKLKGHSPVNSLIEEPLSKLAEQLPELKSLEAPTDQSELASILEKTGASVESFFKNFENTTSKEQIQEEQLSKDGKVKHTLNQAFHYLMLTSSDRGGLGLHEYRTNQEGAQGGAQGLGEGYMLTEGFASAAVVFHPAYQSGAKFRYLGRELLNGTPCYVVAFAQIPEKAKIMGEFRTHSASALVLLQGVAWIDAGTYRILRLRTDLLEPLAKVRLRRQTTQIGYQEVAFKQAPFPFWLPVQVAVTVEWRGKLFRNLHQYSDFKLFQTGAKEKRHEPPAPVATETTGHVTL